MTQLFSKILFFQLFWTHVPIGLPCSSDIYLIQFWLNFIPSMPLIKFVSPTRTRRSPIRTPWWSASLPSLTLLTHMLLLTVIPPYRLLFNLCFNIITTSSFPTGGQLEEDKTASSKDIKTFDIKFMIREWLAFCFNCCFAAFAYLGSSTPWPAPVDFSKFQKKIRRENANRAIMYIVRRLYITREEKINKK